MRNLFIIFVALGFIGVAVFGFLAMSDHSPGHDFGNCIATLQRGTNCSALEGSVSFASFHLNAFKVFSSANSVTSNMSLMFFLSVFVFSIILAKRLFNFETLNYKPVAVLAYSSGREFHVSLETDFRSWIALHEKRDAVFAFESPSF